MKRGRTDMHNHNALDMAIAARDARIVDTVRAAIRHEDVLLAFQPVVQAQRPGSIAFHEGLVRVLDDTGRVVPAAEFIAQVEELEEGRILDCLALEMGLDELAQEPGLRLAINMSARSIGYPRWRRSLTDTICGNPTVAERLILEISEASAMLVPELVTSFMAEMQRRGVSFAMDNFGAGYTALRHLRTFSFDVLKIAAPFIRGIATDPDNQVLTRAILAMAEQFDMFTVAESVETAADAQVLTEMGVDCLQGYFFGAPTVRPAWRDTPAQRAEA